MRSTIGRNFSLTIFGESHGPAVGFVLDGLPAGITLDLDRIRGELDKRKPTGKISTQRHEADEFRFISGYYEGHTTGTPLTFVIENTSQRSRDYEKMKYNTAIAQMMTLVNAFYAKGRITRGEMKVLIQLLNPVAPHITEEINQICEFGPELIHKPWPKCDEKALVKESVEIALQINGKVRGKLEVPTSLTREGAQEYFLALEDVQKLVAGREIRKLVYVPGRLVNIVL